MVWYVLSKTVAPKGRSFHSMQATSQALQPMQVVVSISLQTVSWRWVSSPGTVPACAEIFWMRSAAWLMAALLRFLYFDQEALKFRGMRVGINDRRRQHVDQ